jgi:hypothetical protein
MKKKTLQRSRLKVLRKGDPNNVRANTI